MVGLFTEKLADMVLIGGDSTRVVKSGNSKLYLFSVSYFFPFIFIFIFILFWGTRVRVWCDITYHSLIMMSWLYYHIIIYVIVKNSGRITLYSMLYIC